MVLTWYIGAGIGVPFSCVPSSPSSIEELCTLVITEAFPEDSGLFKCIAGNQLGTVSCDAILEVYLGEQRLASELVRHTRLLLCFCTAFFIHCNLYTILKYTLTMWPRLCSDLEEQMANETPMDEQSLDSTRLEPYDFPSLLHDIAGILPPEWPESPVCEIGHPLEEQWVQLF